MPLHPLELDGYSPLSAEHTIVFYEVLIQFSSHLAGQYPYGILTIRIDKHPAKARDGQDGMDDRAEFLAVVGGVRANLRPPI